MSLVVVAAYLNSYCHSRTIVTLVPYDYVGTHLDIISMAGDIEVLTSANRPRPDIHTL